MENEFWLEAWENNHIAFHQPEINPYLKKYWPTLGLNSEDVVFVPLSGKSKDMVWLAERGHRVVGVELSELAVSDFFVENNIQPKIDEVAGFKRYRGGLFTLLVGDFFDLNDEVLGRPRGVYDRAALVALPPDKRPLYAQKMGDMIPAESEMFLVSFVYEQKLMDGPPFAVHQAEVEMLYKERFNISLLQNRNILRNSPRFAAFGLEYLHLSMYRLRKKSSGSG